MKKLILAIILATATPAAATTEAELREMIAEEVGQCLFMTSWAADMADHGPEDLSETAIQVLFQGVKLMVGRPEQERRILFTSMSLANQDEQTLDLKEASNRDNEAVKTAVASGLVTILDHCLILLGKLDEGLETIEERP